MSYDYTERQLGEETALPQWSALGWERASVEFEALSADGVTRIARSDGIKTLLAP